MHLGLGAILCLALGGCSLGYYFQAINGELAILNQRRPVYAVIADPGTPEALRARLKLVQKARKYAVRVLKLPKSDSYTTYVSLARKWPVWVVSAAPEFSLVALRWCFWFAGCVPYRGYFAKADALAFAGQLKKRGNDVLVRGVPAYSTLGWFADPVYWSMLRQGKVALVAMIFHEMAHQKLYVEDASAFNESFADAVADIGAVRFFSSRDPAALAGWREGRQASRAMKPFIAAARARLKGVYASDAPAQGKRKRKRAVFGWLAERYREVGERYGIHYSGQWLASLDNADLALMHTYDTWVAAFKRLYHCRGADMKRFYAAARRIGRLPAEQRHRRLDVLKQAARAGRPCESGRAASLSAAKSAGGR